MNSIAISKLNKKPVLAKKGEVLESHRFNTQPASKTATKKILYILLIIILIGGCGYFAFFIYDLYSSQKYVHNFSTPSSSTLTNIENIYDKEQEIINKYNEHILLNDQEEFEDAPVSTNNKYLLKLSDASNFSHLSYIMDYGVLNSISSVVENIRQTVSPQYEQYFDVFTFAHNVSKLSYKYTITNNNKKLPEITYLNIDFTLNMFNLQTAKFNISLVNKITLPLYSVTASNITFFRNNVNNALAVTTNYDNTNNFFGSYIKGQTKYLSSFNACGIIEQLNDINFEYQYEYLPTTDHVDSIDLTTRLFSEFTGFPIH